MIQVHEMMGNFSEMVAEFETPEEAEDYVVDRARQMADQDLADELEGVTEDQYSSVFQNMVSYFSIDVDN